MIEVLHSYWSIILSAITVIFYFGYTKAELKTKVDNSTVDEIVKKAFQEYKLDTKDSYIRIDQVPGLQERLKSIENSLKINSDLTQKIYEKILRGDLNG